MPAFNRISLWLSIRSKLLIAFAGLSILPLTFVGIYDIVSNAQTMRHMALEGLTDNVHAVREKAENFLEVIASDLRVLQNSSFAEEWIQHDGKPASSSRNTEFVNLEREWRSFARTKAVYYQLRLINARGDEVARVECDNPNDAVRKFRSVPTAELRDGRERYYFLLVDSLDEHQIAFAPAEVTYHDTMRVPVLSFAAPLYRLHRRVGILVANVFEKSFIEAIENRQQIVPNRRIILATGDGHYLYHSEKKKDWNRLLASREEGNLQRDYPASVVASILSGAEGTSADGASEIISYSPLFANESSTRSTNASSWLAVPVFVIESVPEQAVMGPVRSFTWTFVGFLGLFLGSAIALGLIATQQFTRPISELQRGATLIAQGHYEKRLRVRTHDEIELLADQFNRMAASLEEHEKVIQEHRSHLEEMVALRTQELQGEKAKLQVLLDNVPSAFVLLDRELRIQIISAAFTHLTGYGIDEVRGKKLNTIIGPANGSWEKALHSGSIETEIVRINQEAQADQYLEYVAVPMKEDRMVSAILLIITDITKRKRFEQRLVQAEKLAVAGEMSSIIAHEFRNALTSVKMILQLLAESVRIDRSEEKSLGVALDSIKHMEIIVTELLDFARPKAMRFVDANVNGLVQESIEFVRPHLKDKRIAVASAVDDSLGPMALDPTRFKEAVINLLLNAVQACESTAHDRKDAMIDVSTKRIVLRNTLHDVAYPDSTERPTDFGLGSEIVLSAGSACAMIEVSDNGCGIAKDQLRRIFDPFYTTKTNGTGLGLPMVRQTVTAHGGILTVESVKAKGTTFKIYLPTNHGKQNQ